MADKREVDRKLLFDDSGGRGSSGAVYSTTLGSVLHEIGHLFGMDHTLHGVMGRGFDDVMCWVCCDECPLHLAPKGNVRCSKEDQHWWEDWGGATLHPFSLLLTHHSTWFTGNSSNHGRSESYTAKDLEPACWITQLCKKQLFGTNSLTSQHFKIEPCLNCRSNTGTSCLQNTESLFYYDNMYLRGVKVGEVVFGVKTPYSSPIPCPSLMTCCSVRAGSIIDAVKFCGLIEEMDEAGRKHEWLGGSGGSVTELRFDDGLSAITGTVEVFADLECVSSLQFHSQSDKEAVFIKSRQRIEAIFLFHKKKDQLIFAQDFRHTELKGNLQAVLPNIVVENNSSGITVTYFEAETSGVEGLWIVKLEGNVSGITVRVFDKIGDSHCFDIK